MFVPLLLQPKRVYGSLGLNTTGSGKAMIQLSTTVNVEYPWLLKQTQDDVQFYALEVANMYIKEIVFEMTVCAR